MTGVTRPDDLFDLIHAHMEKYGPSEATVARLANIPPPTLNAWKTRKTLPPPDDLARLAVVIGRTYREVLDGALVLAGWLPEPGAEQLPRGAVPRRRGRRSP